MGDDAIEIQFAGCSELEQLYAGLGFTLTDLNDFSITGRIDFCSHYYTPYCFLPEPVNWAKMLYKYLHQDLLNVEFFYQFLQELAGLPTPLFIRIATYVQQVIAESSGATAGAGQNSDDKEITQIEDRQGEAGDQQSRES